MLFLNIIATINSTDFVLLLIEMGFADINKGFWNLNDPSLNLSENPHFDEAKTKGYLCFGEI
jgi:hypothetical protein